MLIVTADPRDGGNYDATCGSCCCDTVNVRPGETNLVVVNYAGWAVPFARKGLDCSTLFHWEQIATCPAPTGSDLPPREGQPVWYPSPVNALMVENLNTRVIDPEGQVLSYKLLPFQSTTHGKLALEATGAFTYQPDLNFYGYDRFYFEVSDLTNKVIMECVLAIGNVAAPTVQTFTPKIKINDHAVNSYQYTLSLAVAVSPAALLCEIFRLTIRQGALDCDCNCYHHISCIDFTVKKC